MEDWRLVASAGSSLLVATVYGYVGLRLLTRPTTARPASRTALRRFGVFWLGLGMHTALSATLTATFLVGGPSAWLVTVATYSAALVIGAMFWGLMSYLLYLYFGKPAILPATTFAYALQLAPLLVAVYVLQPVGAHMDGWIPMIDYADPAGGALDGIASLIFITPPLVAAWMYFSIYRRVDDRASRWRIALVGGSIGLWFLLAVLSRPLALLPGDAGAILGRSIAIGAAFVVLAAYEPPAWARRRFGAARLGHEVAAPPTDPAQTAARREALIARTRELV